MKFATKLFYSICLSIIAFIFACSMIFYSLIKSHTEQEFLDRYNTLGNIIAKTFSQMENEADHINENAVRYLYEKVNTSGLPAEVELKKLAASLGIKSFYATDKNGNFVRSTDLPLHLQINSLFSYCADYKRLLDSNKLIYKTPIIPGYPYNIPMKLTMISSRDRQFILESGMELEYIGKLLHQVIGSDKNILSMGFYTPTGFELGSISKIDGYHRGRSDIFASKHFRKQKRTMLFNFIIPANNDFCCECINKKVSGADGRYFYILRLEISLSTLQDQLFQLKKKIVFISICSLILSIISSLFLAKKLVFRINKIGATAEDILESGNLDLRVDIHNNSDEIAKLADTFNAMIEALKEKQKIFIESERIKSLAKLAAQVAHDIRSPLAVMEMTLIEMNKNLLTEEWQIQKEAIQSIKDIANNLLIKYRKTNDANNLVDNADNGNIERYLLLHSVIDMVIHQKKAEWGLNVCRIDIIIDPNVKSTWLHAAPNDLKRIFSNLLNNSYESLKYTGNILISLTATEDHLIVAISDNGVGIPPEHLDNVLNGLSLKHTGKGMGLINAKEYMMKAGGFLLLESQVKQGTKVELHFPHSKPPNWYPNGIQLKSNMQILLLDDDISIHNYWRHRLENYNVCLNHFVDSQDAVDWLQSNENHQNIILLIDYELNAKKKSVSTLIDYIDFKQNCYLITSYAEDDFVQRLCITMGIWLIPKVLIKDINISFRET